MQKAQPAALVVSAVSTVLTVSAVSTVSAVLAVPPELEAMTKPAVVEVGSTVGCSAV